MSSASAVDWLLVAWLHQDAYYYVSVMTNNYISLCMQPQQIQQLRLIVYATVADEAAIE
jgi:hypothetical protein